VNLVASIHKRLVGARDENPAKAEVRSSAPDLDGMTLEQLFEVAEGYGFPRVFKSDSQTTRRWHAKITFQTIEGTGLEAGHWDETLRAALIGAIRKAEIIRGQFK
jgi:hypothetical protein